MFIKIPPSYLWMPWKSLLYWRFLSLSELPPFANLSHHKKTTLIRQYGQRWFLQFWRQISLLWPDTSAVEMTSPTVCFVDFLMRQANVGCAVRAKEGDGTVPIGRLAWHATLGWRNGFSALLIIQFTRDGHQIVVGLVPGSQAFRGNLVTELILSI